MLVEVGWKCGSPRDFGGVEAANDEEDDDDDARLGTREPAATTVTLYSEMQ